MSAVGVGRPPVRGRTVLAHVGLIAGALVMLYPLAYIVLTAFSAEGASTSAGLIPDRFSLNAFRTIFGGQVVLRALAISLGVTVVGTALSLLVTIGMAYGLSRTREVPGTRIVLWLVIGAMLFPTSMIPNFLLVKQLGLLNSWWAIILPVLLSAFNLIVMRNFFMELPTELFEAARLDGASEWHIMTRIVLPLSKAVLAVIGLFYAVAYWNAFFNALIYIQSTEKWPMALVLRTFVVNQTTIGGDQVGASEVIPPQLPMQMAILVVAIVPILIVYPFIQRHFAKGVMIGAVKG